MRVKVRDRAELDQLRRFLASDPNVITSEVADDELEIGFAGSLNSWAQQMEAELRVRAWMAAHPDAIVVMSE